MPSDAPPSYAQATGKTGGAATSSNQSGPSSSHLEVPGARNGIPADHRRSMEDQARPLPKGWVRTYDPETSHQFFVDTTKEPPRSIWCHPYDDEEYLSTLSSAEREQIEHDGMRHSRPSKADIMAEHTDEEEMDDQHIPANFGAHDAGLPPRTDGKGKGKQSLGRKMKDKLTGTTHEERELERKRRAEEEERLYQQHLKFREAMSQALRTGKPQLLGKDKDGKDVYIEPPQYNNPYSYGGGGYAYNPYGTGMYTTPNARYIRPQTQYQRPYGMGYGGGYGMPLALGGGLLGGMMLGNMMMF